MPDRISSGTKKVPIPKSRVDETAATKSGVSREDAEVVQRILEGDAAGFDTLYSKYERRIYFFALKRLGNPFDAEDVTQEVFLQVLRGLHKFEGRSTLLTWMFGIAHNQVCRRFRRVGPDRVSLDSEEICNLSGDVLPVDERIDFVRILRNCSRIVEEKVTPQQQEAFTLRYIENHSTKQIAEEMGKSAQAIKISLYRTRKTLANHNRDLQLILMTA